MTSDLQFALSLCANHHSVGAGTDHRTLAVAGGNQTTAEDAATSAGSFHYRDAGMSSQALSDFRVLIAICQPFARQVHASVDALSKMSASLEGELRSLLTFFGENPDSPEAPKPEDFFGMILSFSSSLQKAALEVHDTEVKTEMPEVKVEEPTETPAEAVSTVASFTRTILIVVFVGGQDDRCKRTDGQAVVYGTCCWVVGRSWRP